MEKIEKKEFNVKSKETKQEEKSTKKANIVRTPKHTSESRSA